MQVPTLETQRLILRPFVPDDADAAFAWQSDPRVNKFMVYSLYKRIEQTKIWIDSLKNIDQYLFGIVVKEINQLIGSCGIGPNAGKDDTVWGFGYNLAYDYWNKGFATEAAKRMIEFAYEQGIRDFIADHAVDNPASGRVMEKCGMTPDGFMEYSKSDGSATFKARLYRLHLD